MKYFQVDNLSTSYVKQKIKEFLKEDHPSGDITTENIYNKTENIKANIQAGENLIFCGKKIVKNIFNKKCKVINISEDGKKIKKNEIIGKIKGPAIEILKKERVLLNIIQRMSAISTKTNQIVKKANPYKVKILDTRKTTPGIRMFEKYAVKVGGGWNHRMDLSTGILIKDNHIKTAGGVKRAVESIRKKEKKKKIEIEVDFFEQIEEALQCGVDGFLLDNMEPKEIKKAVKFIKEYNKKMFIEASGGITKETISSYLKTGIDAISIGAITHSISNIDIKLEFL